MQASSYSRGPANEKEEVNVIALVAAAVVGETRTQTRCERSYFYS